MIPGEVGGRALQPTGEDATTSVTSTGVEPSRLSRDPLFRQSHRNPPDWTVVRVEEPRAEIRGAARIDDGRTDGIQSLCEGHPLRDTVVDDRLTIAVDADHLFAIEPPDRSSVGANRNRTLCMSCGTSTRVTAQNSTFEVGLSSA